MFGLALITKKPADEQKLSEALARLADEDPCLEVSYDARARRTVVRGLGELHLKIVLDELAMRWNLQLDTAPPAIPYRETITEVAEALWRLADAGWSDVQSALHNAVVTSGITVSKNGAYAPTSDEVEAVKQADPTLY